MCQHRKPFFGYVRRVSNRAPGPSDQWWASHEKECGGYFKKVGEPDGKPKAPRKKPSKPVDNKQPRIDDAFKGVLPPTAQSKRLENISESPSFPKKISAGGNIRGFNDLNSDDHDPSPKRSNSEVPLFRGPGHTLSTADREIEKFKSIQEQVRASWAKRYGGETCADPVTAKKPKLQDSIHQWQMVDTDIAIKTPFVEVVELLDSDSDEEDASLRDHNEHLTQLANKTVAERRASIKRELMESDAENDDEIEMIDDEFDDAQDGGGSKKAEEKMIKADDIVKCPICEGGIYRNYLSQHMEEGCLGIRQKVAFNIRAEQGASSSRSSSVLASPPQPVATHHNLAYDEDVRFPCPNCHMRYSQARMNDHLDTCLVNED